MEAVRRMLEAAIAPLRAGVERLRAEVEEGEYATGRSQVEVAASLAGMRTRGSLRIPARQAPAGPSILVRRVAGSQDISTGAPRYALSVRSAARLSVGLGYQPPVDARGHSVADAIGIEQGKARLEGFARGLGMLYGPGFHQQVGILDPVTGLRFATLQAAEQYRQVVDNQGGRGVPFGASR